ncbi:MAG: TonB-dependent receptor plug domain-containing protein, partial [Gammaproteobacteria bacterium]|nr:TonB-dependent receptor plug domain-containing protein [Gammaproteobacteria bacterium]
MTTRIRSVIACRILAALALLSLGIAFEVHAASAAAATAPAALGAEAAPAPAGAPESAESATTSTTGKKEELEVVTVYGLAGNLEKSLEMKKMAPVVMDSIDSTQLGRFPDADVADSLAHLPGISIERTTGGEGQKITVRGLSSQYNIVTLNNRILTSDDDGRDLAFDVLPAELITGAEVLKSPEAAAVEGSIGGTVNLR